MSGLEYNSRIYADWSDPDPREMSARLVRYGGYLANTQAPMEAAMFIAISDIREHFEEEEDPEGEAWEEWAESYEFTASGENVGILRKTEDLFFGVIDPSSYTATDAGLYFDPSGLPEYWLFHELGTEKIPARPYIGLSDEAQIAMEEMFFNWMQFGGEVFMRGGREVRSHVLRAPTGHFIPVR